MANLTLNDQLTNFLLYTTPNSEIRVEITMHNETVWLPQKEIAKLFNVNVPAISKHLKNIFESGELEENSVVSILETTASDGKKYSVNHYNLDAILSIGYRVNSLKATQFRIWATKILKELGLIEQWGSGIARIKKSCLDIGLDEPKVEEMNDFVYVEFFRPIVSESVGEVSETTDYDRIVPNMTE
jgi:predicted HTH transcriptional regulator